MSVGHEMFGTPLEQCGSVQIDIRHGVRVRNSLYATVHSEARSLSTVGGADLDSEITVWR